MKPNEKTTITPNLDLLYSLINDDLKQVNALILERIKQEVPLIHSVAEHIIASGGKRVRPALTLISAQLCGYVGTRHVAFAASIEFIHTATLLHDDVVDESALRRGKPTANIEFGNKASVLVGDFLLSQAFQLMVEDGSLPALSILANASAVISKGEVLQLIAEGNIETTEADYVHVISAKTAVLFAAAAELGAVVAGNETAQNALREYGMHIGIAFQLVDDALDYHANQATLGKTIGDDFREGKLTLPVLIALANASAEEKNFWARTMGERKQTEADLAKACEYLQTHDAINKTLQMADDYAQKAKVSLMGFAPSTAKTAMLELADFCVSRSF